MKKEIVINAGLGETRAAILEDRRLVELFVERQEDQRVVGNIYKGRVENVLPGMQAAFVNIGLERNAFLYVDDAMAYRDDEDEGNGNGHTNGNGQPKVQSIKDILREGQHIIVQVTKEPIGTKGARIVTHVTLPGRYFVLMPTVEYIGVSRRIHSERERNRLKSIARRVKPKGMGLIVRTVAEGKSEEELAQDCRFLEGIWERIQRKARRATPPALLYKDYDLVYRLVRDAFTSDIDKFVVDSRSEYEKTLELLDSLSPHLKNRVYLYHEGPPIFDSYGVEPDLERALQRKVWLDCGGYLVIDHTEALISIDVNTGRHVGTTNLADTVFKTNLEAATEIARQLRLRDMGGIIIVDFIDMESKEHERKVLERLEQELRKDKTRTHVLGFTNLGLVEITRKKVKQDIGDFLHKVCPHCEGSGHVLSEATVAHRTQREIRKIAKETDAQALLVAVNPTVAALMIGAGGSNLRALEEQTGKTIFIKGTEEYDVSQVNFLAMGTRAEVEAKALPVRVGQVVELDVEEPHVSNPKDGIARIEGYVVDIEGAGRMIGERLEVEIVKVFRTYAKARIKPSGNGHNGQM